MIPLRGWLLSQAIHIVGVEAWGLGLTSLSTKRIIQNVCQLVLKITYRKIRWLEIFYTAGREKRPKNGTHFDKKRQLTWISILKLPGVFGPAL
jgi:hypothetical protein